MKLLEEFWYGNIEPTEYDTNACKEYREVLSEFRKIREDAVFSAGDDILKTAKKKVVELAKPYGAAVEAEIGCVGGSEDGSVDIEMHCTSPVQAKEFYEKTGVDALAIAIGNAHGNYKEEPKLRFDILEEVRDTVSVPLVLHGGTGISPDDFIRCHQSGIKKIKKILLVATGALLSSVSSQQGESIPSIAHAVSVEC